MPLGILQAAAWVDVLSVKEISEEIQNSVDFLESEQRDLPERQRSMRAVFDYSWRLLNESEREGLARMSMFRGGCTREAAQSVSGASIRLLTNLVNKSLLRRDQESGRYEMHVLMQQFAEEQLEVLGTADDIRDKHAAYYLNALADLDADLKGSNQIAAIKDVQADFENVRAAWQWAVAQRMDALLLSALEPLAIYCKIHSRLLEELDLLTLLKEKVQGEKSALVILAEGTNALLRYQLHGFDPKLVEVVLDALTRAESLGDPTITAQAQVIMGKILSNGKRYADALPYFDKSLSYYESIGDIYHQANVLQDFAYAYTYLLDEDKEKAANRRALELYRQLGNQFGMANALNNLDEGTHEEAYQLRKQLGDKRGVAWSGVTIALNALEEGDIEKAQVLIDEALHIIDEINFPQATMWVLTVNTYLLFAQERYQDLLQLANRMGNVPVNRPDMLVNVPAARFISALGTGKAAEARQELRTIIDFGASIGIHFYAGGPAALILEQEGKPELALTLYTIAVERWSAWRAVPLMKRMVARIQETLSVEAYQQAVDRASALTSEEVFAIYVQHGLT